MDMLFDVPAVPVLSDTERKRMRRRAAERPRGHYALPGTGPEGETCRTCAHYTLIHFAKAYRKCGRVRALWTGGPRTDIRAGDPACRGWEPRCDEMPEVRA
jgi:hypothetical protein